MNIIVKNIKNSDGSIDKIIASSNDNSNIMINDNYKLIKFSSNKKRFKDTIFGADIGIHSHGFISVSVVSLVVAITLIALMYLSFRI